MIAMPPTEATSQDDYRKYFRALGRRDAAPGHRPDERRRRDLTPTTELILDLARELPNFGYVKEESDPLMERMKAHLKQKPHDEGHLRRQFRHGLAVRRCASASTA